MMVAAIDNGQRCVDAAEAHCRRQPAEPGADDDDARPRRPGRGAARTARRSNFRQPFHPCSSSAPANDPSGPRLFDFLRRVGADLGAKHVGYQCADGYDRTIMTVKFRAATPPVKYGDPFPMKLGFENPKWVS
jgi:hypothetical protein